MPVSTKKHQITIEYRIKALSRTLLADEEHSVLQNLIDNDVDIDHSCGGFGTCGTCCVQVVEGMENLSQVEDVEAEMKIERGMRPDERLCCQSFIKGPVKILIP